MGRRPLHAPISDPRLDDVRQGMDPQAIQSLLNHRLTNQGGELCFSDLTLEYGQYEPFSNFHALYRATLRNGSASESQLLFGRIAYAGDDAIRFAKAERKLAKGRFVRPQLGYGAYHLPEIGMVLWTYPNDPTLKTLTLLQDPLRLRRTLARFESRTGWEPGATRSELVHYIPGKRATFRYDVEWRRPRAPDGSPVGLPAAEFERLFGKVYDTRQAAERSWITLQDVWRAQQGSRHAFRVPRPLHFERELLATWCTRLPGSCLGDGVERVDRHLAARIGRGLAALHQGRVRLAEHLRLEDEFMATRTNASLVARVHPEFEGDLQMLLTRLEQALPLLPRLPLTTAHGSFKLNHLLVDEHEGLSLLDLDSMVMADPALDLANLVSELICLAVQGTLPAPGVAGLETACREAYAGLVPWPSHPDVLDWYTACLLIRKQAFKSVKHLHPDARDKIRGLIEAATDRLRRLP